MLAAVENNLVTLPTRSGSEPNMQELRIIDARLTRIEDLLSMVVRMEERQVVMSKRFDESEKYAHDTRDLLSAIEKKVDMWIARGVGLWIGVSTLGLTLWTMYTQFWPRK